MTFRLPEKLFLERSYGPGEREVDIAKLAIAVVVDLENYDEPRGWPYPLFLYDGQEAHERHHDVRSYWHIEGDSLLNSPNGVNQVTVPSDGSEPWVYMGSAVWPSSVQAHLFEEELPYNQAEFEKALAIVEFAQRVT